MFRFIKEARGCHIILKGSVTQAARACQCCILHANCIQTKTRLSSFIQIIKLSNFIAQIMAKHSDGIREVLVAWLPFLKGQNWIKSDKQTKTPRGPNGHSSNKQLSHHYPQT